MSSTGAPDERPGDPPTETSGLTTRTVRGLKWTYLGSISIGVMQLIYTAVMSRLLAPRLFGIFAIASLVVTLGQYFTHMGLGQALIQRSEIDDDEIRATWTSSVVLGIVMTVLFALAAPAIAGVFHEPDAVPVLQVMSLSFLFIGLQLTSRSLLRRQMRFRVLAITQAVAFLIAFLGIGIAMAMAGAGVWSLVGANLGSRVIGGIVTFIAAPHPLRPTARSAPYRDLYAFGIRVSGIQLLEFASNNLDTFAVGRYATTAILGQYNRGFYLVNLPLNYLRDSLSQVLFPGFSQLKDERARLRGVYVGATSVAAAIVFPLCAALAVAAPDVVEVVIGEQWDGAAQVVPLLAFAAAFSVLSRFAGIAAEAIAELDLKLTLQGVYIVVLGVLLAGAAGRAIWAYGLALAIGEFTRHGLYLSLTRRTLGVDAGDLRRIYGPAVYAAVLTATAVGVVRSGLLALGSPVFVRFVAEGAAGLVALVAALRSPPLGRIREEMWMRLERAGAVTAGNTSATTVGAELLLGRRP
ncbi:MAG: lipopolysaccharide biosynthesis protein [Actinobacteria bacterium]|nr:lipopolysaccharide biosynthesis protein [Actinomycetota bacterium]